MNFFLAYLARITAFMLLCRKPLLVHGASTFFCNQPAHETWQGNNFRYIGADTDQCASMADALNSMELTIDSLPDTTYTKTEIDAELVTLKKDTYTKAQVDDLLTTIREEIVDSPPPGDKCESMVEALENMQSSISQLSSAEVYSKDVVDDKLAKMYTQTEVDTELAKRAIAADTYTKAQVDDLLAKELDKVYAAIKDGDKLRRQREAERKDTIGPAVGGQGADDNGYGNGDDSINSNGSDFNIGVAVGASVSPLFCFSAF